MAGLGEKGLRKRDGQLGPVNDFNCCSYIIDFNLFAVDSNLFYENKSIISLETQLNLELLKVNNWVCANKLSLNISKSNFVIFHLPQKQLSYFVHLFVNNTDIKQERSIKYLWIIIDSNLSWKDHIQYLIKKLKRNVGLLSKIRYFVNFQVLKNLYYALIYPFLIALLSGVIHTSQLLNPYLLSRKEPFVL